MTWYRHTSSTHEHKCTSWAHIMDPWRAVGEGGLLERRMRARHATVHATIAIDTHGHDNGREQCHHYHHAQQHTGLCMCSQRLAHHRALVQGEDELGRKCSRERLGVDSPYAYPGNPHSGARAVVMSLTSCHGQVARTRAPEASAESEHYSCDPLYSEYTVVSVCDRVEILLE